MAKAIATHWRPKDIAASIQTTPTSRRIGSASRGKQGKKRDYSRKKRPTDDNQRRQVRRKAQREREKAAASMAV